MINIKYFYFIMGLGIAGSITSCQPDEIGSGNGLADPEVDATFTVTPVEGQPNRFTLEAETTNVLSSMWNTGDGFYTGNMTEELFLPEGKRVQSWEIEFLKGFIPTAVVETWMSRWIAFN